MREFAARKVIIYLDCELPEYDNSFVCERIESRGRLLYRISAPYLNLILGVIAFLVD